MSGANIVLNAAQKARGATNVAGMTADGQLIGGTYPINTAPLFGASFVGISESDGPYTAWPYNKLFFDATAASGAGRFVQLYMAGSGHTADDRKVYSRRRGPTVDEVYGGRVIVSDATTGGPHYYGGASKSSTCMSAGMLPNGDYGAIVRHSDTGENVVGTRFFKSTDDAVSTWTAVGQLVNAVGGANLTYDETGGWLLIGTKLFCFARYSTTPFIIWCDTSVSLVQWNVIALDKTGVGGAGASPLEGQLIQLADGTIVCLCRQGLDAYPYVQRKLCYSISTDNGLTWSALAYVNDQFNDASNGNVAFLYDSTTDICHLWWSSRYALGDGYGSLYYSKTTGARLKLGYVGNGVRVARGSPTRDFGYPAVARNPTTGAVVLSWYDGGANGTAIYNSVFTLTGALPIESVGPKCLLFGQATTLTMGPGGGEYVADNASQVVFTLPANAAPGAKFKIYGNGAGGWKIAQQASQQIVSSASSTTAGTGGSITSVNRYDCIELVCVATGLKFAATNIAGSPTWA